MSLVRKTEQAIRSSLAVGPAVERSERWVRVRFGGEIIADSRRTLLLRQYGRGRLPTYYFPPDDVRQDVLRPGSREDEDAAYWHVQAGGKTAENAAWTFHTPPEVAASLKDHIAFKWHLMDAWYEEEEEVFVHARDPYKRIDVLPSSRHVRVVINGQTIAESDRPFLLFETSLPTRYYLPREDVRMDLLQPTDHSSRCPYKGVARYWTVHAGDTVAENVVWSYPDPIPEMPKIAGLLSFYNERVDLYVDGELQPRPRSPWSA